jgi:4-amino-4-deoxy-L-arabinose transferase-like glycosyltransferase
MTMSEARSAFNLADRLAIAVLAAVAIAAALTFKDYGLGWDDYTHSQYGELLLKLYGSGFSDTRVFSFVNLFMYGGGFDMAAALAAKILPFDLFDTRRLIGAAIGVLGLFATWRLGRRLGGPNAGFWALVLLASCPLYYGHMYLNAKDSPFATAMIFLLLGAVRTFDEYPNPSRRSMVLVGVALGAAFGSRILALVAVPYLVAGLLLIVFEETRTRGLRNAGARMGRFILAILPALPLAYLIMGLLWPWSILAPLNPLRAAEYFDKFFEKPWREMYDGTLISVTQMPASYVPHLFALQLPEIMLALGLAGCVGATFAVIGRDLPISRRASLLIVTLAAILPVAIVFITRPALYNGLRHFVFLTPPFAVLGGLFAGWLMERTRLYGRLVTYATVGVFLAGISLPVVELVRLHPFEYTSFNLTSGGIRTANDKFMLDYWGLSFKQASADLRTWLAKTHVPPPKNRSWVVAICGPQSSARQELGPQFETTYDQKKADFALALGTYYCRHLQAPVLASIEREGIVYARVYDLRGRANEKLVTEPPP